MLFVVLAHDGLNTRNGLTMDGPELHDKGYYHYDSYECELRFNNVFIKKVKGLQVCHLKRLSNRDLLERVLEVADYGVTVVSNLMASRASAQAVSDREGLEGKIDNFHKDFKITKAVNQKMFEFLLSISPSSETHLESLEELSKFMPHVNFANSMANAAIVARAADLETISKACVSGIMATNELAELTGDENLKKIDPKDTKIVDVRVDLEHGTIDFVFTVRPSGFGWLSIFTAVVIIAIAMLIFVSVRLWFMKRRLEIIRDHDIELGERARPQQ